MAISRKKTTTKCLSSKNRIFEWPTKMWVKWKWIMQTQKGDDKHEERRAWWHHHLSDCFVCAPLSLSQQQQQQQKTRWSTCFTGGGASPLAECYRHCDLRTTKKNNDNKKGSRTRALPNAKQSALLWYLNFPPAKTTTTTKRELLYNRVRYSSTYTWQELKGASLKAQVIIEEKLFFFFKCVCVCTSGWLPNECKLRVTYIPPPFFASWLRIHRQLHYLYIVALQ